MSNKLKGFLRLKEVLELIPVGESTWYRGVNSGYFPKPIKIMESISAWKTEDIEKLIEKLNGEN